MASSFIFIRMRELLHKQLPQRQETSRKETLAALVHAVEAAIWRRRRDLNPRAGYPTYALSRGASSPT